jgi:hypothetical protein
MGFSETGLYRKLHRILAYSSATASHVVGARFGVHSNVGRQETLGPREWLLKPQIERALCFAYLASASEYH